MLEDIEILAVTTRHHAGYTVVSASGELDLSGKAEIDQALASALARPDGHALIVDLTALRFIDSSGIHSLIIAHRETNRQGRPPVVVQGGSAVMRVLELCGLKCRMTLADDLAHAVALTARPRASSAAA